MNDIEKLRKDIDQIDKEIVNLFEKRMEIVIKIAEYKKLNGIDVTDNVREEEIISKNLDRLKNKEFSKSLENLFKSIFSISKDFQNKYL